MTRKDEKSGGPGYPEHDKLARVRDRSQAAGEVLDWLLNQKGVALCRYGAANQGDPGYYPISESIERLLAEYFDVDLDRLEEEKRRLLEEQRALYRAGPIDSSDPKPKE